MGESAIVVKQIDLEKMSKDMGRVDSFRYNVLTNVSNENYEAAIKALRDFLEGEMIYPSLKDRTERYIHYSVDLVNAIRAKRNFPGVKSLTIAKQKELNDKYLSHFYELQQVLKRVERIEKDIKIEDSRSTTWVVKAVMFAMTAILCFAFVRDLNRWLMTTMLYVVDDGFQRLTVWLFSLF